MRRQRTTTRSRPSSTVLLKHYVGRPSALYFAERLTENLGGAKIYLKREDLNHTGAHKINNCLGQILLARRMGKTRIIAETGAGQHGVATATVAARFGLPCVVYMGEVDIERQKPNVFRMKLLGAEVRPVTSGSRTLKDAMNEALRDWVANVEDTFYIIGSAAGPHPYPQMVRDFQTVIGNETRAQILEAEKAVARSGCRLRRRRFERDRHVPSVPRRSGRRNPRGRSGGRRRRNADACRDADQGLARRAAWRAQLSAAGSRRADSGSAFDFGRPRLSRRRARTFLAQGSGPREIFLRDRQGSAWKRSCCSRPARRHHSRTRALARDCPCDARRARAWRRTRSSSSRLSGRGDKDVFTAAAALGEKL